jgi:hypothetical protein
VVNLQNQVLSRTVAIGVGENKTVLDFNRPGQIWRLSVQETGVTSSLLVTVRTGYGESSELLSFHVGPGGAVDYLGCNSAMVEVQAVQANTTVDVQVGPPVTNQFVLEHDGIGQSITNAAWTPLGANNGFAEPFMNYAAIMTSGTVDIRTVGAGGGTFFEALGVGSQALLLNQLKIGNHDRLEARGAGAAAQNIRVVWYNRR